MTKNKRPRQIFLIEAIQTFRMRYLVETEEAGWAEDSHTMEECEEWQQKFLGEQIITTRAITREEAEQMHADDNVKFKGDLQISEGSPWLPLDRFIMRPE